MAYKDKAAQAACAAAHYAANKQVYKDRAAKAKKAAIARNRAYVDLAKSVPCMDCGVAYPPYVMDFDHLGDKVFNIADAVLRGNSIEKIQSEIEKCEVVCSNCHRERTHSRRAG